MTLKLQYDNAKLKILNDNLICPENRKWIKQVLEYQEIKGKRSNGLPALDDSCYKTLLGYILKCKNVNKWFDNKPLKNITEKKFLQVYEDLEEARITKRDGGIFKDRESYYNKIFKGKPFEMIGKNEMAKKVIQYNVTKDSQVRFIPNFKDALKDLVQNAISPSHKLLIQLQGDFGENIFSILQLEKKDFERIIDKETKEPYYLINLHKEILKRRRTPRREYNIFPETLNLLDKYLENLKSGDRLFNFGLRQAEIMFNRAVEKSGVKLQNGEKPTLKDLRSSMACHLLNENWTTDDIKGRLGHKPSSKVLDVYVSYLALNKDKIKKKHYEGNISKLQEELEKAKELTKLQNNKIEKLKSEREKDLEIINEVKKGLSEAIKEFTEDRRKFKEFGEKLKISLNKKLKNKSK